MDLPSTIYDLPFLDEQAKRNILGGNAKRVFNLEAAGVERRTAPNDRNTARKAG